MDYLMNTRITVCASLLVTGVVLEPAFAQTLAQAQGQAEGQALADVVVSASRSEQRSFDAPAAIQSVGRAAIEDGGPQVNLSEALKQVPGLTILNRQNYAQDLQVSIRGFGSRASFGIRGIRLLIDGIPATTPDGQAQGSSISLTSTERIEVLRGPLAQLYGNASGGVIQAFTREAPETPEFSAQAYGGSYGLQRTDWQYAGRSGSVGIVADYSTFKLDGYRDNSAAERNQFNGRLSFALAPSTRMQVVFNQFDMPLAKDPLGLDRDQLAANPTQAGTGTANRTAGDFRVRKAVSQNQIGSSITHTLDADWSLTARTYYGTRDNLQLQAGSGAINTANYNGSWVGLDRSYFGAALQLNGRSQVGGVPVLLATGYDFDRSREVRQGGAANLGERTTLTRDELNKAQNSDVFAQATFLASDQVSVVTGVRSSSIQFSSDDNYLADNRNGSGERRFHATSPIVGLTFHAARDLNLYANYGKGFETPTLSEVAYRVLGTAPIAEFNPSLNASVSHHRELGAKWTPLPAVRADLNLYQIDSRNEIVVSTSSGGQSAFQNAPGTSRRGAELNLGAQLNPHLRASVAANWIEAEFSQAFSYSVNNVANKVGNGFKIPGIPQHFIFSELLWTSIAADAARPTTGSARNATGPAQSGAGARVALELIRAGQLVANDTNTESAPGYTTWNLMASQGWALGRANLTAYARVDNLLDEHYVGSVIVNQSAAKYYEPSPGRTWTLGLRYRLPLR